MAFSEWAKKADFDMMFKRYNVIIEGPAITPEDDPDVKKVLPKDEPFKSLAMAVIFGDTDKAVQAAKTALERTSPLDVIEKGLAKGMDAVSALYAKGAYFLPDIMLSADAMTAAMAVAEQKLGRAREKKGT
ncbi:MAG: B12-binding domain-containing protein, partial [Candidatus Methanosuratincola sp.]|nr:B12-binding domain-containing protein [Candidatus Methanosuratincola sp.]